MGRKAVRNAVAQYLSEPQVPGIGTVYASPPKISRTSDATANLPAGVASAARVYVEVLAVAERRLGAGGPVSGVKEVRYSVTLHVLFQSRQDKAEDAMDDHDDMLEILIQKLRDDRTLGTNGTILQSGQDRNGYATSTGLPKLSGTGSTLIWSLLNFDAVECIQA